MPRDLHCVDHEEERRSSHTSRLRIEEEERRPLRTLDVMGLQAKKHYRVSADWKLRGTYQSHWLWGLRKATQIVAMLAWLGLRRQASVHQNPQQRRMKSTTP